VDGQAVSARVHRAVHSPLPLQADTQRAGRRTPLAASAAYPVHPSSWPVHLVRLVRPVHLARLLEAHRTLLLRTHLEGLTSVETPPRLLRLAPPAVRCYVFFAARRSITRREDYVH